LLLVAQVGFKLLAFDVRVASGLAFKAMRGNTLTRWGTAAAATAAVLLASMPAQLLCTMQHLASTAEG
jgi:hypothetical protein